MPRVSFTIMTSLMDRHSWDWITCTCVLLLVTSVTVFDVTYASTAMITVGDVHVNMNKIGSVNVGRYKDLMNPDDPNEVDLQVSEIVIKDTMDDTRKQVAFGRDGEKFSLEKWQGEAYQGIAAHGKSMNHELPEMGSRLYVKVNVFVRAGKLQDDSDVRQGDVHVSVGLQSHENSESCTMCDVYDHVILRMTVTSAKYDNLQRERVLLAGGASILLPSEISSDGEPDPQPMGYPLRELADGKMAVTVYLSKFRSNVAYSFIIRPTPDSDTTSPPDSASLDTTDAGKPDSGDTYKSDAGGQQGKSSDGGSAENGGRVNVNAGGVICLGLSIVYALLHLYS